MSVNENDPTGADRNAEPAQTTEDVFELSGEADGPDGSVEFDEVTEVVSTEQTLAGEPEPAAEPATANEVGSVDMTETESSASQEAPAPAAQAPVQSAARGRAPVTSFGNVDATLAESAAPSAPAPQASAPQAEQASYPNQGQPDHVAQFGFDPNDGQYLKLVRSAWRWAAVTVLLFPILSIWALPSAASVTQRLWARDLPGAREHANTSRALGLASLIVFVLLVILWFFMSLTLAAELDAALN